MKKTTKRLLAAVLCLVMVLGALPLTALAEEVTGGTAAANVVYGSYDESNVWSQNDSNGTWTSTDGNIKLSKTAEPADNPNEYTVTLQVELKKREETAAAATVLTFDRSGSMNWCAECGKEHCNHAGDTVYQEVYTDGYKFHGEFYIIDRGAEEGYAQVYHCSGYHGRNTCDGGEGWYYSDSMDAHTAANKITPKANASSTGTQLYKKVTLSRRSKLDAAKDAAKLFLKTYSTLEFNEDGTVKTGQTSRNLKRYVSVVSFAATSKVVKDWVDVSNSKEYEDVLSAIDSMSASGGTNLDSGLRRSDYQFSKSPITGMRLSADCKNVVLLSDGKPTYYLKEHTGNNRADETIGDVRYDVYGDGANTTDNVKNGAKDAADTLKGNPKKATLYTVSFSDDTDLAGFLSGSIATSSSHAYSAKNDRALQTAFETIAEVIVSGLNAGTVGDLLPDGVTTTDTGFDSDKKLSWVLRPNDLGEEDIAENADGITTYTYTKTYTVTIDPDTDTDNDGYVPLNGKTTFTYTDATGTPQTANFPIPAGKVTPNTVKVTFNVVHGTWSNIDGTPTTTTVTIKKGASLTDGQIPTPQPNADYTTPGSWDVTPNTTDAINEDKTFTYTYRDKTKVNVTFTVVGGTWNGKTGDEATSFNVNLNYGDTLDGYIPTGIPDASHYGSGTWTDDTPTDNTTVTANVVYTLTYARRGEITITGGTDSKTYNGYEQEITNYDVTGLPAGYNLSGLTYSAKGTNVGNYNGEFSGIPSIISDDGTTDVTNQYTITTTPGKLTITKKDVTITVNDAEKNFGEGNPTFTGTVTGLVDDGDLGTINYKRTSTSEAVGTYENDLTADYTENGNYHVTVENGDFTIKTATSGATLSAAGGTWEYDGTAHTPTVTLSDDTYTVYYKVGGGEWTTTVPSVTNVSEGTVTVSVKATKTGYTDLTDTVTLNVNPAPVTIKVDDAEKYVGEEDPTFTGTVTGLVNLNDLGAIYYYRMDSDNAVGTYDDVLSAQYNLNSNYTITVQKGDFEIKEAPAAVLSVEKEVTSITRGNTQVWPTDSATNPTAEVGDVIVWTITVTNSGNADGKFTLTDTLTGTNGTAIVTTTALEDANNYYTVPAKSGDTNGTIVFIATYTVVEDDNNKTLKNTVKVSPESGDPTEGGSGDIEVDSDPNLSVAKTVYKVGNTVVENQQSIPTAQAGDTVIWKIVVTNSGKVGGDFTLTDMLGTTPITTFYSDPDCAQITTDFAVGTGNNDTATYYVEYDVTADNVIGSTLVNKVTLREAGKADKDSTAPGVPVGGLTVEKDVTSVGGEFEDEIEYPVNPANERAAAAAPTTAKVGETITWTITVTNYFDSQQTFTLEDKLCDGSGKPITGAAVQITLPEGVTRNKDGSYNIPAATHSKNENNVVVITPKTVAFTASYKVQESDEGKTLVNNVKVTPTDGTPIEDDAPGVEVEGKLSVDKTVYSIKRGDKYIYGEDSGANAIPTAKVGDDIIWKIKVTNTDSDNAYFKLEDILGTTGLPIYGSKLVGTELVPNGFDEENKIIGEYMILGEEGVTNIVSFFVKYTVKPSDLGSTLVNTVVMKDANDGKIDDDTAPGIKVEDKPNTPSYNPNYNAGVQLEKGEHFNYVIGYSDGTVRPEGNITRAEVATIFFRLLTDESRKTYLTEYNTFTDVEKSMWHNVAISTLARAGVLNGYNDGSFRPDNNITRAEMAAIISRFAELEGSTRISFTDIKGHWAEKSILLAASNGWINGYNDGSFRPDQNITRAETFAMINRVLERKVEHVNDLVSDMNTWVDNMDTTQWYYFDVQEATNYHSYQRKYTNTNAEKWIKKLTDIDWTVYQY